MAFYGKFGTNWCNKKWKKMPYTENKIHKVSTWNFEKVLS